MKIAVVDDMETERNKLCGLCEQWAKNSGGSLEIKTFSSGEEFLKELRAQNTESEFDMVFMDIYMSEVNGIEAATILRESSSSCLIVFLTTSEEHVWEAFPLHPFDYVVKPYADGKIFSVLDEALKVLPKSMKYIEVTSGRKKIVLKFSSIVYVRAENHHMMVLTENGEHIKAYSTFSDISDLLLKDTRFTVCNRGVIVNMDFIERSEEFYFKLKNGEAIALRVKDAPLIRNEFASYCFKSAKHWRE